MKILVVIPDPLDDEWVPVMATEEWQTIAIAFAQKGISVTLFNLYPPTWNNLRQTLSGTWSPFDVVHFIGHGNSDGIVLEDEWGEQDFILTEDLSLALVQSDIRLIVLNVCESELPAEALVAAGLSTVIGTTESIDDGQALILAHELYATLATGQTIEKAMVGVRAALHHSGDDEDIPIVIGRVDTRFATASDTQAIPRSKILNKPRNNLQYSGSFFGRRAELAKGLQLLGDAQCRGIEITGIGGTGKTAYTLELANRGSWRFYGGILWLDGVSHFSSLEQILLNKVNSVLIGDNEQAIDSLDDAVKLLNSQAILMVFDNADKLSQSVMTQLQAFTKRLNPLIGSMIILTSRIPTMFSDEIGDIASLPLSGLDVTSTLEFVRHRARLQNINEIFALSDYELKELMVQLGGNPKLIQMLLGLIGSTGLEKSHETLKQLSGPIPDALESLVGELVTTLNEADLDVLLASTLFVSPFHIDDIMTVVSFDNSQDSLITLTKRGLLDRYSFSSLCTIHPLVGDYIATKYPVREHMILQHATFVADQMRKLISTASHLRDRTHRYEIDRFIDEARAVIERLQALTNPVAQRTIIQIAVSFRDYLHFERKDWNNIQFFEKAAAQSCRTLDDDVELGSTLTSLAGAIASQGDLVNALQICNEGIGHLNNMGTLDARSVGYGALGYVHRLNKDRDAAQIAYQNALQLAIEAKNITLQIRHTSNLGNIFRQKQDWMQAGTMYQEALNKARTIKDASTEAIQLDLLGITFRKQGNYSEALNYLEQAYATKLKIGDRRGLWITRNNLAMTLNDLGRAADAIPYFENVMDEIEDETDILSRWFVLFQLSRIYRYAGQQLAAIEHYNTAMALAKRMKNTLGITMCERGLSICYEEIGDFASAYRHITEAVTIASQFSNDPYLDEMLARKDSLAKKLEI